MRAQDIENRLNTHLTYLGMYEIKVVKYTEKRRIKEGYEDKVNVKDYELKPSECFNIYKVPCDGVNYFESYLNCELLSNVSRNGIIETYVDNYEIVLEFFSNWTKLVEEDTIHAIQKEFLDKQALIRIMEPTFADDGSIFRDYLYYYEAGLCFYKFPISGNNNVYRKNEIVYIKGVCPLLFNKIQKGKTFYNSNKTIKYEFIDNSSDGSLVFKLELLNGKKYSEIWAMEAMIIDFDLSVPYSFHLTDITQLISKPIGVNSIECTGFYPTKPFEPVFVPWYEIDYKKENNKNIYLNFEL